MTHIDMIGNIIDAKYSAWLACLIPADFRLDTDMISYSIDQAYDIQSYFLPRSFGVVPPIKYFNDVKADLRPWVETIKTQKRNIFTVICKALYRDTILYEDFIVAIRNLVEMCKLHSVATLAIARLGCNPTDCLSWDKVSMILDKEFKNTPIELIVYEPDQAMAPVRPEQLYKQHVYTPDVYEIPESEPLPDKARPDAIYHEDGTRINKPYPPMNRMYKYGANVYKGPYPEFEITIPTQYKQTISRNTDPEHIAEMAREWHKQKHEDRRYFPDHNGYPPEVVYYKEFIQDPAKAYNGDKVRDPMDMYKNDLKETGSHAYQEQSIVNQDIFYKPDKPIYEYPAITNIPDQYERDRIQAPARGNNQAPYIPPMEQQVGLNEAYPEFKPGWATAIEDYQHNMLHPEEQFNLPYGVDQPTGYKANNTDYYESQMSIQNDDPNQHTSHMNQCDNVHGNEYYNDPLYRFMPYTEEPHYNAIVPDTQPAMDSASHSYKIDGQFGQDRVTFDHSSCNWDSHYIPPQSEPVFEIHKHDKNAHGPGDPLNLYKNYKE